MAIEYRFLDRDDETLIKTSELPLEGGIAVAALVTGFDAGSCEVVEISIADFSGDELFSQRVKPQNCEGEFDPAASGGITAADVAEAPELFQFEDDISALYENASIIVAQHAGFVHDAIESSWVSLPGHDELDLIAEFCASHCASDYPGEPAAVADLAGIAAYYDIPYDGSNTSGIARTIAACYKKLVGEHAAEREAKGSDYWAERDRRLAEEARNDKQLQAAERSRAIKTLRINALMWLCAAAIFSNLAVQTHINGYDAGFTIAAAAAAVFTAVRWIMCLYKMYKLRKQP